MHIEVFYIDASNGWAAQWFDDEGNMSDDEAEYSFHKRDAIRTARFMSQSVFPIHVYSKDGRRLGNVKMSKG